MFIQLPMPDWVVSDGPAGAGGDCPARPADSSFRHLLPLSAVQPWTENRLGLAVASSAGPLIVPDDPRGFSSLTPVHSTELGLDFGRVTLGASNPEPPACRAR